MAYLVWLDTPYTYLDVWLTLTYFSHLFPYEVDFCSISILFKISSESSRTVSASATYKSLFST